MDFFKKNWEPEFSLSYIFVEKVAPLAVSTQSKNSRKFSDGVFLSPSSIPNDLKVSCLLV